MLDAISPVSAARIDPKQQERPRIGVYVHFPYCLKKCPYCDFVSYATPREEIDHGGYADAVLRELETRAAALDGATLQSVFFGGGTPSLWAPAELGRVLAAVLARAPHHAPEVEVTVECNPTSLDEARARELASVGVNRLSVGVQGLDEERLRFLGRLHDAKGGLVALREAIASGIARVSGDLIYGVATAAGRTMSAEAAASEASEVAATGVTHVSAYSLTIEPGTQFGELARRGRLPLADDDLVADAFFAIEEVLEARGLTRYEVSNYAKPGHEARHNLGYWRGDDYVGLGCGAFGTVSRADGAATRYRNEVDPARYLARSTAPTANEEALDPEMRLRERILLGLRLRDGFDLSAAAGSLALDAWTDARKKAADRLVARDRLIIEGDRVRIPRAAFAFADRIAMDLF
jgi:oxygen-independent coproporphyrinogen-3 oxidase